jgi:hypothetical protein
MRSGIVRSLRVGLLNARREVMCVPGISLFYAARGLRNKGYVAVLISGRRTTLMQAHAPAISVTQERGFQVAE